MMMECWSHHIDRDNLSDDEDEYPNNMVDQPSLTMKIMEWLSIISSSSRDDCKSLHCDRLSSNTGKFNSLISSHFIHIHQISLIFHHDVSCERWLLWVKHERHPMNIDEIRGDWWIEYSSLTKDYTVMMTLAVTRVTRGREERKEEEAPRWENEREREMIERVWERERWENEREREMIERVW